MNKFDKVVAISLFVVVGLIVWMAFDQAQMKQDYRLDLEKNHGILTNACHIACEKNASNYSECVKDFTESQETVHFTSWIEGF